MRTKEEIQNIINEENQKIRESKLIIEENRIILSSINCPFKIGDTIREIRSDKRLLIESFKRGTSSSWSLLARPLKKDGTPSKLKRILWGWNKSNMNYAFI